MTRSVILAASLLAAVVVAPVGAQEGRAQRWRGTFADGAIVLRLEPQADGSVEGTFELPTRTLAVRAERQRDGTLQGTLASEGRTYAFSAQLDGDAVVL